MQTRSIFRLALIGTLAACFACQGKEPAATSPAQQSAAAAPGEQSAAAVTAVVKTENIPPAGAYVKNRTYFKLPAVKGGEIDLADYAGKPLMVMFFTETCHFCRKAAPHLEKLYTTYKDKGFTVLGICIQNDPRAPANFAAALGTTFPMAYGGRDLYGKYQARGVPYIFLLNKKHEVLKVWPGYTESFDAEMVRAIESVLAEQ